MYNTFLLYIGKYAFHDHQNFIALWSNTVYV